MQHESINARAHVQSPDIVLLRSAATGLKAKPISQEK
jgi:hypothetical protein